MILKRYFVEGLAQASYLFGSNGAAAVVDPKRDIDDYIDDAKAEGLEIVAIFNSHPHADFASGFMELAERTGAEIYISHRAPVSYESMKAKHGDRVRVGNLQVEVLETPGHSPDSLSFLVHENGKPTTLFTGDLLFVGDVGRPDLRDADEDPKALANKLYESLFDLVMKLPDEVTIGPAHGAGSLCGRNISSAPFSTVGQERATNWAIQITDREEFARQMTSNLPDRPRHFAYDVDLNLKGAPAFGKLSQVSAISEPDLKRLATDGASVIDTRTPPFFGAGHFSGSLNIGLASPLFSTWVGFLVPPDKPIALVVGSAESVAKARLELARIGYDDIAGYIEADSLTETQQLSQLSVCDLKAALKTGTAPSILDVRTPKEYESDHIEQATNIPLPSLPDRLEELKSDQPLTVLCGSGYRSSIAASLLQKHGVGRLSNVMGGMGAYLETKCPELHPADLVFPG